MHIGRVTRVGCKRDARKALMGELEVLGAGVDRVAFRDTRGEVAYKVCHEPTRDWANRDEARIVERCRRSQDGRDFVAPTTLWVIDGVAVVAQPCLYETARAVAARIRMGDERDMREAEFDLLEEEIENVAADLGIADIHRSNWGFDQNGRAWIIDAATAS